MRNRTARRCTQIGESVTVALNDLVKTLRADGASVLDLAGGDPGFDTPRHITDEAVGALRDGQTHYPPSRGVPGLLRAISDKLREENGVTADPATEIIVTPSSKHALFITMMAILDPGDEVLIPTPSWVSYQSMAVLAGADPVPVELDSGDGFTITRERLAAHATSRTKALVINTPNNPTGRVLSPREANEIAAFAEEHDIFLITDEIYEKIRYQGRHISLAAHPRCADRSLTVNGFSKAYAMPGWRLGYVAGPADIIAAMLGIHQHTVACAGSFIQAGGVAALTGSQGSIRSMTADYTARAEILVRGLNSLPGIRCPMPEGTFYAFPEIKDAGLGDSVALAELLLSHAGVAVTPGTAFGPGGEGHVRVSFAAPTDVITEALDRMRKAMSGTCIPYTPLPITSEVSSIPRS